MDFVKEKDLAIYPLQETDLPSKNVGRKSRKRFPEQMKNSKTSMSIYTYIS